MAYRALLPFDQSASYMATAKLGRFNGVPMQAGERMPAPPADPGAAKKYTRVLRSLYETRKIDLAPAPPPSPEPSKSAVRGKRHEPRPAA